MPDDLQGGRSVYEIQVMRGERLIRINVVESGEVRTELDSHADTCVGGPNCMLLEASGSTTTVHSFSGRRKPFQDVPIGTVATAYTDPDMGETYILVIAEALYFGNQINVTLLNPNQMRNNGVKVENVPVQYDKKSGHCIQADGLNIPLKMNGVISYFDSRYPSEEELENCTRIYLTADIPWEPYSSTFESQEEAARQVLDVTQLELEDGPQPELFEVVPPPAAFYDHEELAERFINLVNVAADDLDGDGMSGHQNEVVYPMSQDERQVMALSTDDKSGVISKEVLAC